MQYIHVQPELIKILQNHTLMGLFMSERFVKMSLNLTRAQTHCDEGLLPRGPPLQVQDPRVGRPHHLQRRRRQR